MVFVGIYRAIYDYLPQGDNELAIKEGDLLFVLEKSAEDDWWRARRKAGSDEEEEPEGLIPSNYIEEAKPLSQARALYDYARQTDEELSFSEGAKLRVYDTSDPDWTLVGLDGEFGFAPANYIEMSGAPPMPARHDAVEPEEDSEQVLTPSSGSSPIQTPAAAIAGIIQQKTGHGSQASRSITSPELPKRPQYTPDDSEEDAAPSLPQRPQSGQLSPPPQYASRSQVSSGVLPSPPYNRSFARDVDDETGLASPGGFRMYSIHEVVSHMGKNKKMPTTLGINLAKGVIMISPDKSKDGPQKEWTAEKLTTYSMEGKHVFMELVRPSKSADLHAGSKDTAKEICSVLGELAGAARAEGLREVLEASGSLGSQKKGQMLYEFMAQGEDEVTVAVGDEVIILDDKKSDEWWMVRRLKNGKEGVVPSSYVEITGTAIAARSSGQGLSAVERNRMEEERLTKEARSQRRRAGSDAKEVGGLQMPDRLSSLKRGINKRYLSQSKRDSRSTESRSTSSSKPKPDATKLRTWTDRSGSFKVEAEFLGLKDNKIHLHKSNGVKIAVPVTKMSSDDIEYVERVAGISLDDEKPLSDIKRRNTQRQKEKSAGEPTRPSAGTTQPQPRYDWFDFFLACGVNPQICERYASAFTRDQMGEESMPEIEPHLLRTLGLKEGDILRVMKYLDKRFGRTQRELDASATNGGAHRVDANSDSLFSGPGGSLKNNTRKGRPAPAVQTNDLVDPELFVQAIKRDNAASPMAAIGQPQNKADLSFDDEALETDFTGGATPGKACIDRRAGRTQSQSTGAAPGFFDQLAQTPTGPQLPNQRQRPPPPQQANTSSLIQPPPPRAISAPQNQQQSALPPLMTQMTGFQPSIAPPGQSMQELSLQQYQQQYAPRPMQAQPTGFASGYGQMINGLAPQQPGFGQYPQQQQQPQQQTGFGQSTQSQPPLFQSSLQQQFLNGQQTGSPFADPPRQPFQPLALQPTGYQQPFANPPQQLPQQTAINNYLPPSLQPQMTGYAATFAAPQPFSQTQAPPPPPMPQSQQQMGLPKQTIAPLLPQKTGPAPPIRFGVQPAPANRLMPQTTGRRANLAQATPQNPFGF